MSQDDLDTGPWYKQFWLWFVLGPMILIVIVCAVLVTVALKHADDVVSDNYYKDGRMINKRLEQDDRAVAMGISGELRFDQEVGEVLLKLSANQSLPEKLLLYLQHPTSKALDQKIVLHRIVEGQYRGDMNHSLEYRWYLRVLPTLDLALQNDAVWRLNAEIDFTQTEQILFTNDG